MFDLIRKHKYTLGTRLLLILLGGLMTIFFGTVGAYLARVKPVATINCRTILFVQLPGCQQILADDIDREANSIRNQVNNYYGKNAPAILERMNLRETAVDQLIQDRLVENEADRLGLSISDDQLEQAISTQTAFQTGGQFDVNRYRQALSYNNIEPAVFENETHNAMLTDAVREMIEATVQIGDAEARRTFDSYAGKVSLAYIEVPYSGFEAAINSTGEQVARFYHDNAEAFREPDRAKISFVRYDPAALAGSEMPTDQQIQDYYDQNLKTQFTHPAQARARHILISAGPGATSAQEAAAKSRAEDILKKLRSGADFATLAKQYSEDPGTRDKGGELGFFGRGELVKPFEDVAFALKPGEYGVAQTQFGSHVIQVEELKPDRVDTPEEARPKIIEALRRKGGEQVAKQYLQQDLTAVLTGHTLQEVAQKRGLTAVETQFFAANEPIRGAEDYAQLGTEALKLQDGEVRAMTDGPAPYLVKLIARNPAHLPPLTEIQDLVRKAYVRVTAEKQARQAAETMLKQVKAPNQLDQIAAENHFTVIRTGDIPRTSPEVPGIGTVSGLMAAVSGIPKLPGVIDRVMESGGNSFVFAVLSRSPADPAQWKIQGPAFTARLLEQRRASTWANFVNSLKSQAEIVEHADLIGAAPG